MAVHGTGGIRAGLHGALAGMLTLTLAVGCSRSARTAKGDAAAKPGDATELVQAAKVETRLNQSFADATLSDQPDQYLPDLTLTRKSVGKLYEQVVRRWDGVSFLTAKGERVQYSATIETELGRIEVELLPDVAPNHVRSFVALAQVGYYDGLVFERTVAEQSEADPQSKVELVEGGCPTGTGNPGYGSIGYWLKPEFSKSVHHGEGSVGACRWEDPGTAACRFYITLSKAPVMDGQWTIFGKVARGLDVVRRIATQPVANAPEYPLGDRPEKPIVMRKVAVQGRKVETTVVQGR